MSIFLFRDIEENTREMIVTRLLPVIQQFELHEVLSVCMDSRGSYGVAKCQCEAL